MFREGEEWEGGVNRVLSHKAKSSSWKAPIGVWMLFWDKTFESLGAIHSFIPKEIEFQNERSSAWELCRFHDWVAGCCESMVIDLSQILITDRRWHDEQQVKMKLTNEPAVLMRVMRANKMACKGRRQDSGLTKWGELLYYYYGSVGSTQ